MMKSVLVLKEFDVELVEILENLNVNVKIINNVAEFKREYYNDNVLVISDKYLNNIKYEKLAKICKELEILIDPYILITKNFSKTEINNLTSNEIKYIEVLKHLKEEG